MAYEAPDLKPSWYNPPGDVSPVREVYPLDSFGTQWAECENYADSFVKCDLRAVDKDGSVSVYGRYYASDSSWRIILPPGVFAYSGFDYSDVVGVVKNGRFEPVDSKGMERGELAEKVVSADAVVVER